MKKYVIGLLVSAIASITAFGFVIVFLNPRLTGPVGPVLLLSALYIFLTSIVTLIGFVLRVWLSGNEIIFAHLGTAFRQGLLISLVLVGSLVLQLFRIFNIWSGLLFVIAIVLTELAFQSSVGRSQKRSKPVAKKRVPVTDVVRKSASPESKQQSWSIKVQQK